MRTLPKGFGALIAACAVMLVCGILLQMLMPNGFPVNNGNANDVPVNERVSEIHGSGPIRLNEIMSSNSGALVDYDGHTPDWVEVANVGSRPVNIQGYALARSTKSGNVFAFPDMILEAGQCVIVYADSRLETEAGGEFHAPFRLSSTGDELMLFNNAEVAVDTVNIPALGANVSYVRVDTNTWEASEAATPGMLNTAENYNALSSVSAYSDVKMVEIVASNTQYRPDENGVPSDYVVLRNTSGEAADIGGWFLSDDPSVPRKWRFPAGTTIAAGGTLVVYCDSQDRADDPAHPHTSFNLSSEGETVTLSNVRGQPMDTVTYDLLRTDTAYLRGESGWSVGTPGQ